MDGAITTGPLSEPSLNASPGTIAISITVIMISAEPRLRGLSPNVCTSDQAIGAMMAVRTVIDGISGDRISPIKKNAESTPV